MAASQSGDTDALTFETPDGEEIVTVPETFGRDDYAAHFGGVADEWDTAVVFAYDGLLRAGAFVADEWVEAIYQTEATAPVYNASECGWVVEVDETVDADTDAADVPGEVLWTAADE